MLVSFTMSVELEITELEEKVIVRHPFEVEPAELFVLNHRQARIQRVQFSNLNVRAVDVIFPISKLGPVLVAGLLTALGRVVRRPKHAVEGSFVAVKPHADINKRNLLRDKQIEDP